MLNVDVIDADVVRSVSCTRRDVAPAVVGVPLTSPVAGSTLSPAGTCTPNHDKFVTPPAYGTSWYEYGTFLVAFGIVPGDTMANGTTVKVKGLSIVVPLA